MESFSVCQDHLQVTKELRLAKEKKSCRTTDNISARLQRSMARATWRSRVWNRVIFNDESRFRRQGLTYTFGSHLNERSQPHCHLTPGCEPIDLKSSYFVASSEMTTFPLTQFSRTTTLRLVELLLFCDSRRTKSEACLDFSDTWSQSHWTRVGWDRSTPESETSSCFFFGAVGAMGERGIESKTTSFHWPSRGEHDSSCWGCHRSEW